MTQTKHIEMRNVRKAFRFFTLEDLSLDLEPGQIMGLVGPNGAGKSTTIRLLTGLLAPDAGEVRVLGHAMPDNQAVAKRDIGFVSDDMRLFPHATLGWHMQFVASIYPGWDAQYAAGAGQALQPAPRAERRAVCRSGEHVKAVLLLALARRPRLLILDEPTSGLDPVARHEVLSEFMDVLRDDRPLDPLLLAQHRRRGAHLRSHHLHRPRPPGRQQRQGRLPRALAPHPAAASRRAQRCRTCRTSSAASSTVNSSRSLPTDSRRISSHSWAPACARCSA